MSKAVSSLVWLWRGSLSSQAHHRASCGSVLEAEGETALQAGGESGRSPAERPPAVVGVGAWGIAQQADMKCESANSVARAPGPRSRGLRAVVHHRTFLAILDKAASALIGRGSLSSTRILCHYAS
jgi:hypothetical protein